MANIAQTVNVLQAMILTDKEKMLLTPTYHVFEMYKVHHDATLLPVELQSPDYAVGSREDPDGERVRDAIGGRAPSSSRSRTRARRRPRRSRSR